MLTSTMPREMKYAGNPAAMADIFIMNAVLSYVGSALSNMQLACDAYPIADTIDEMPIARQGDVHEH